MVLANDLLPVYAKTNGKELVDVPVQRERWKEVILEDCEHHLLQADHVWFRRHHFFQQPVAAFWPELCANMRAAAGYCEHVAAAAFPMNLLQFEGYFVSTVETYHFGEIRLKTN
jgi:hypothetical protein